MNRYLAVIGYGSIGKRHVKNIIQRISNYKIVVLRNSKYSDKPPSNRVIFTNSLEEVFQLNPYAVLICNPAPFHIPTAKEFAKRGIHLFIEKPLSNFSEGVKDLIDLCNKKELVALVGYNLRFFPSLIFFKEKIENSQYGKILSIQCEVGQYLPNWRKGDNYKHEVSARKDLGGGVLLELSHEIDYLQWIFGDIKSVYGIEKKQSTLEVDVEDSVFAILEMVNKKDNSEIVVTMNMDFYRQDQTRFCKVIFERGTIIWDGIRGSVKKFEADYEDYDEIFSIQNDRDISFKHELDHFLECISNNIKPKVDLYEGLKVINIIEAIKHSSRNGSKYIFN